MSNKRNTFKRTVTAMASAIGLAMASTAAFASHIPGFNFNAQDFTINPSAVGEAGCGGGTCTARFIDFSYQAEVNQTNTGLTSASFTETGAGFYGTFRNTLGGPVVPNTGLNNNYALYLIFNGTGTIAPGPGGAGVDGTFNAFNFQIWVDRNQDTAFSATDPGAPDQTKTVASGGGDDALVLTGTLVPGEGGFHVQGGLANGDFDVILNVSRVGTFFGGPAFAPAGNGQADLNGVNSTILGANPGAPFANATDIIINGSGNNSFQAVPEPATLALLGLGLAGLGASVRRRITKS